MSIIGLIYNHLIEYIEYRMVERRSKFILKTKSGVNETQRGTKKTPNDIYCELANDKNR